jgi:hypothetical protein
VASEDERKGRALSRSAEWEELYRQDNEGEGAVVVLAPMTVLTVDCLLDMLTKVLPVAGSVPLLCVREVRGLT